MNKLQILATAMLLFLIACGSEKSQVPQTITSFFPATQYTSAGINVFSPQNAGLKQYFVQDGKWVLNENIPSIQTAIKGQNYRMQYLPSPTGGAPNLLLYSATGGEFQFYYLDEGAWKINTLLPGGIAKFATNNITMEFTRGNSARSAFLFASAGNEVKVLEIKDGEWEAIDYFPASI